MVAVFARLIGRQTNPKQLLCLYSVASLVWAPPLRMWLEKYKVRFYFFTTQMKQESTAVRFSIWPLYNQVENNKQHTFILSFFFILNYTNVVFILPEDNYTGSYCVLTSAEEKFVTISLPSMFNRWSYSIWEWMVAIETLTHLNATMAISKTWQEEIKLEMTVRTKQNKETNSYPPSSHSLSLPAIFGWGYPTNWYHRKSSKLDYVWHGKAPWLPRSHICWNVPRKRPHVSCKFLLLWLREDLIFSSCKREVVEDWNKSFVGRA